MKKWIMLGLIVGSIFGGFVPAVWGDSSFGVWAILTSTIGAILGIWAGYEISQYLDY